MRARGTLSPSSFSYLPCSHPHTRGNKPSDTQRATGERTGRVRSQGIWEGGGLLPSGLFSAQLWPQPGPGRRQRRDEQMRTGTGCQKPASPSLPEERPKGRRFLETRRGGFDFSFSSGYSWIKFRDRTRRLNIFVRPKARPGEGRAGARPFLEGVGGTQGFGSLGFRI